MNGPARVDLLRHGRARPADSAGDAARPLTPEGAAAVRALGLRLRSSGWEPRRVLTSRYTRAMQTTSLVLAAAGVALEPEVVDELVSNESTAAIAVELEAKLDGVTHALLVGHEPLFGELVDWWAGESGPLDPGELVAIEFAIEPGRGVGRVIERIVPR